MRKNSLKGNDWKNSFKEKDQRKSSLKERYEKGLKGSDLKNSFKERVQRKSSLKEMRQRGWKERFESELYVERFDKEQHNGAHSTTSGDGWCQLCVNYNRCS